MKENNRHPDTVLTLDMTVTFYKVNMCEEI